MTTSSTKRQREFHLRSYPSGMPTAENFELVEFDMPAIREGEFLVQNEWLSVDPYMRGRMRKGQSYVAAFELGKPMEGGCVGKVVESKHPRFSTGDVVLGNQGWRKLWISSGEGVQRVDAKATDLQNYLGVLGMTGLTAYVGLNEVGKLQAGETVFVSAASGAVGSIVCQIAKLKNCQVIGSAGSAAKIQWLKEQAGVDQAFNYHEVDDVSAKLAELCPGGIDLYFDNVGGEHLQGAIDNMNDFGRIVCCGMISSYNDEQPQPGPNNLFKIIGKRLRMEGFLVFDHVQVQPEFHKQMSDWIEHGKIKWEETITEGLENAPEAFIDLFGGQDKIGKALVRVD